MMKIAIIGGGAAGMMAAIAAKEAAMEKGLEVDVVIFEKNNYLGAKVLLSGGGRCNLTTGITDLKKVLENYPRGAKFLRTALFEFGPEKVMKMFWDCKVKLKIEEDMRVFPASNDGKMIVGALEDKLKEYGVEIILDTQVMSITAIEDKNTFSIRTWAAKEYIVDKVILTTGGNAYKQTGSTGDGYTFVEKFGHKITKLAPSLSAFVLEGESFPSGVSFEKVDISLAIFGTGETFKRTGPCLFTHTGITGPAVFALSSMVAFKKIGVKNRASLFVDFFPDESVQDLETRFLQLLNDHGKKRLVNLIDMLLPHSFCALFLQSCKLDEDLTGAEVNREKRKIIIDNLKGFQLHVTGRSPGEEFVTAGGVDFSEVDHKSMQSKIVPGLYFAGEILDIDGFTGGFNLQSAWSTGYLAGKSVIIKE